MRAHGPTTVFFNYYSDYYHVDANLLEIKRDDASDRGALLIIGDSFASRIEELFTVHYDKVYRIDPRFKSWTIDSFLDNHPDVHDAVILLILTDVLDERVSERFQLQDSGS